MTRTNPHNHAVRRRWIARVASIALLALLVLPSIAVGQTVTSLTLIDADSDTDIGPLTAGAIIDLSALGTSDLNIRANTQPSTIGSVRFGLDGNSSYRIENGAPYALEGNSGSDYADWTPSLGNHTVTATPYSGSGASGSAGAPFSVTFTVIDGGGSGPSGNLVPVVSAGPAQFAVAPATSVTLQGSATDPDGSIAVLEWTQVWGPAVSLAGAATATATVSGLSPGMVCVFRFTALDDQGASGSSDVVVAGIAPGVPPGTVSGELQVWHRVTVDFAGPATAEEATPNPFLDHRLDVIFTLGDRSFVVPGFFAADGDAAESGADSGNVWRARFAPDEPGVWSYTALFRSGPGVAIADDPSAGSPEAAVNGASGTFTVVPSDKIGRDFRREGLLEYVGGHHLRFRDSGRHFLKGGADSPENFLGYDEFDGTFDMDGTFIHTYTPHLGDWFPGDPEWGAGLGHGIIGALNYLSGKGANSVYFLTMNVGGDGRDVWPWTAPTERTSYDTSKLDQWEIIFEHMDRVGIQLHAVLQETENDQLLDGGSLGTERRIYHRELVARMGHHLALVWNLGEENTNTGAQQRQFARHLRDLDPYDHPIVVHTHTGDWDAVYEPLLGFPSFEGPSLQIAFSTVHSQTLSWIQDSADAGRPWVVCSDENGPAGIGVIPDADDYWHDVPRQQGLWGNLMAGGAGSEWYFGFTYPNGDRECEDFRSRDHLWDMTRYALDFFQEYLPFWEMTAADSLTSSSSDHCLALAGEVYAIYLPDGGTTSITLPAGSYSVEWYDPRFGGSLRDGSVTTVVGPGSVPLGAAPGQPSEDWAILVRAVGTEFLRADANGDGSVNITDVIVSLEWLFGIGPVLPCRDAGDTNDDGSLDLSDPVSTLTALFNGGSIPAPSALCGTDPTADSLGCLDPGVCP